jgi:hypothetical protein
MKSILTLLALSMVVINIQAQVLFSQDFESNTLAPMTDVDVDGKTIHSNVANLAGPTWRVVGNSRNRRVLSTSWFTPVGVADDWLISPRIEITE